MIKKNKNKIKRYILGTLIGVLIGLIMSKLSGSFNSQCMLLCQPKVAMTYFGLVGFMISLK
ncbi:MAG: hypothetical protein J7K40_01465 [candidate division Zixibacteria bacterium]|nr:hypothetical protein [candidate division Zixibacteria bacterium]